MKVKITAASSYDDFITINHGYQKFSVHIDNCDEDNDTESFVMPRFQISEIHPYDDAEYTWAKRSDELADRVLYIRDGRIVEKVRIWSYKPDEYEDPTEYVNDVLDTVAVNLMKKNSDVDPKIIHN